MPYFNTTSDLAVMVWLGHHSIVSCPIMMEACIDFHIHIYLRSCVVGLGGVHCVLSVRGHYGLVIAIVVFLGMELVATGCAFQEVGVY